jgi:2,3-bisphosphoglycerate-dependent phosphoglycerate mutase
MIATRAWLIRHGQSQANAGVATEHPQSIALTDLGREQAQRIAQQIPFKPRTIIVSPYSRTLDTAQPLLSKLRSQGFEVVLKEWPIQEFTYLSPVRCRGTTAAERQLWAKEYWQRADPDWEDGDGAESFRQLMTRVQEFSSKLAQETRSTVVFGHGMFFKAFLISLDYGFDASAVAMRRYRTLESADPIHNAQIVALQASADGNWFVDKDALA